MTDLKLPNRPKLNGFSPGFVCSIANVLVFDRSWSGFPWEFERFCVLENEIVRNLGEISEGRGMYTASVQTIVFLDRFSIVVELMIAN